MKVPIVCHRLAIGHWIGMKTRKSNKEKLKSSREVFGIMRGLTGGDYMHAYSHF